MMFASRLQATGSISSLLNQYVVKDIIDDGARDGSLQFIEVKPLIQVSGTSNQAIDIAITDRDFTHVILDEGFINLRATYTFNFSDLVYKNVGPVPNELQKGMFMFIGLKNSSDLLKDYAVIHNGITVTNSLNNHGTTESILNHITCSKRKKNNHKHVYSLYDNVQKMDTSIAGVYIPYSDLAALGSTNRNYTIEIPVNIPINSILPFEYFTTYPNALFGELRIVFHINPDAFVFAVVDPRKSTRNYFYSNGTGTLDADNAKALHGITHSIPKLSAYDRGFFNVGSTARIPSVDSASGTAPNITVEVVSKPMTIRCTAYSVGDCVSVIHGFNQHKEALETDRQRFRSEAAVAPAERISPHPFAQLPTAGGVNCNQSVTLSRVTEAIIYFPKSASQTTCFENPMLQNLQLTVAGKNYPKVSVNSIGPIFLQQQLIESHLALFGEEATDEYEDSLTTARATSERRLTPRTDLTSFIFIVNHERSSGAGLYFDGLESEGQSRTIELRGGPIHQGANDTYWDPIGDSSMRPIAPSLALKSDCFWIFTSRGNGTCSFYTDRDVNDAIKKELA